MDMGPYDPGILEIVSCYFTRTSFHRIFANFAEYFFQDISRKQIFDNFANSTFFENVAGRKCRAKFSTICATFSAHDILFRALLLMRAIFNFSFILSMLPISILILYLRWFYTFFDDFEYFGIKISQMAETVPTNVTKRAKIWYKLNFTPLRRIKFCEKYVRATFNDRL